MGEVGVGPVVVEPCWTVHDAAAYFQVTTRTVYEWVRDRRVPYRLIGKHTVRFLPAELAAFVAGTRRGVRLVVEGLDDAARGTP